jgi:YVTN family beta-propeller protein
MPSLDSLGRCRSRTKETMTYRLALAAVLLALLPNAVVAANLRPLISVPVRYAAPAGDMPAGHLHGAEYDAVLPSGRIVTPTGASVVTGMGALGFALSPDGRYAIVSNDDRRGAAVHSLLDPSVTGGSSLAVIDTTTMQIVDHSTVAGETYWAGVAALADPLHPGTTLVLASGSGDRVYAFTLDASGRLALDARHVIALPAGNGGQPGSIAIGAGGRRAYVVDAGADSVSAIDTATRRLSGSTWPVGFAPFGVALAGDRLLVTDEGTMHAAAQPPAPAPPFGAPPSDLDRASALSLLALDANGDPSAPSALPMDPTPDGLHIVGGAHPTALATTPDGAYAFVAMTNVDRIATVRLDATPHVVGGTELRLFDRGPYGTQPAALALSRDGTRLYVALAGLNAVAVIDAHDPVHLHRLGLIATGWYPTALALGADDRTLYVLDSKGFGHDAFPDGDPPAGTDPRAVWSTFEKIDLDDVRLTSATQRALADTRRVVGGRASYPSGIDDVVVIEEAAPGFDAMLGDLGAPAGDPSLVRYPESVTPNLHALARRYALATNLFADSSEPGGGHQFLDAGMATLYAERARAQFAGVPAETPDQYPRLGYLFDALARQRISFRDYGALLQERGSDGGAATDPRSDDPTFAGSDDVAAPTQSLGGLYAQDTPALVALDGHVDLNYPGWNLRVRDERRAHEFIRDYGALVAAGKQPHYAQLWLPDDATGSGADVPPAGEEVADGDRALGEIVGYLSHLRSWRHTVILIVGDAAGARDHVDPSRSYALVVSPFAKRHHLDQRHLSTVSVLKTSEELLHVGSLSLGDLLATDMSDCLTSRGGDGRPFTAIPVPAQTASR